jgi:hypothetical protein
LPKRRKPRSARSAIRCAAIRNSQARSPVNLEGTGSR